MQPENNNTNTASVPQNDLGAKMDEAVLKLKSYEAMVEVANGNATKIIVPSDLQGLVTAGVALKEGFSSKDSDK